MLNRLHLGSLAMLLLFAAASFAQGDDKISAALSEKGIPLSESFSRGAAAGGSKTVRVKLAVDRARSESGASPAQFSNAVDWREHAGEIQSQRFIELSKYLILCVSIDDHGEAVWMSTVADPRRIRSEQPDGTGALTGKEIDNPDSEILVTIPADRNIREVRFFHPEWNGEAYVLTQIGSIKPATEALRGR